MLLIICMGYVLYTLMLNWMCITCFGQCTRHVISAIQSHHFQWKAISWNGTMHGMCQSLVVWLRVYGLILVRQEKVIEFVRSRLSRQSRSLRSKILATGCFRLRFFWPVACAMSLCHGFAAVCPPFVMNFRCAGLQWIGRLGNGAGDVGDNSRVSAVQV
jgi:hypothetical protein